MPRQRPNRRQFECPPTLWAWVDERAGELGVTRTGYLLTLIETDRANHQEQK